MLLLLPLQNWNCINNEAAPAIVKNNPIRSVHQLPYKDTTANHPIPSIQFLTGRFNYRTDTSFLRLPDSLSTKEVYLKKEAFQAFFHMQQAARKSGLRLKVISGTRNFSEQKAIWERKWALESQSINDPIAICKKILTYSSMPSTSRHHWGTDMDINSLQSSYFKSGRGLREYQWLTTHAKKYGFHQVYSKKTSGRTGYNEEEWHWSYMPLSSTYLNAYNASITYKHIYGFTGSENAPKVRIIEDFVNGIQPW